MRADLETEVLVVGGGMAGMITAYLLAREDREVTLIEKDRIGSGTTAYTTAFLTADLDTYAVDLIRLFGLKGAKLAWNSHAEGINILERICIEEGIECEFRRVPCYIYSLDEKDLKALNAEAEAIKKLGFKAKVSYGDLGIGAMGFIELADQAKFHPLKFLYGFTARAGLQKIRIFEKTEALSLKGNKVALKNGRSIKAEHIISATYYPFDKPKSTFAKKGMYVSYILEAEIPKGKIKEGIYLDMDNPYNYFRIDPADRSNSRIIFGGADHRAELKISPGRAFGVLEDHLKKVLQGAPYRLVRRWQGGILEPSDGLALIGRTAKNRYVATAFSGNGMTYSAITGKLLTDLVQGRKNAWADLYDPRRKMKIKRLLSKGVDYAEEFVKGTSRNILHRKKR